MSNINNKAKNHIELRATITRADGTVEDLGVIASSEDQLDPNSKIGKIYFNLKKQVQEYQKELNKKNDELRKEDK